MTPTHRLAIIGGITLVAGNLAVASPTTAQADLIGFASPSGNIGCVMDSTQVRCDILERYWAPPPPPPDCEYNYGQGIVLDATGPARFVCAGDTALASGGPLAFGDSVSAGLLRCESAPSGMTCRNTHSGQGFSIAREGYRFF